MRALASSVVVTLLVACAGKQPTAGTAPVVTPVRRTPPVSAQDCPDVAAGATRWLDSRRHVAFFITDGTGIHAVDKACCTAWAQRGLSWRVVGPYGDLWGTVTVTGDAKTCGEVTFDYPVKSVLLAAEDGSWRAPRSAQFTPNLEERSGAEQVVGAGAALYFVVSGQKHVVAGGDTLRIAALHEGVWVVTYSWAAEGDPATASVIDHAPVAVLDLDGNGVPEVVYSTLEGDAGMDRVLTLGRDGSWSIAAESFGR